MLFELSKDGNFSSYEMWFSKTRNRFVLVPVESHIVTAGLYQGVDALLAGEVDLLELKEDAIVLHGQHFRRLGKKLSSVGEVLSGEF